jgi:hypothetical protein
MGSTLYLSDYFNVLAENLLDRMDPIYLPDHSLYVEEIKN